MDILTEIALYFSPIGGTRRLVMLGCVLLGTSSGVLGTFALLRRQSLLGDAMSHAALPGICLAFMITHDKNTLFFLVGALSTGLLGAWCISFITRNSRIKSDTAIGLVLSVFFGFGVVLLTWIQKSGAGNQAGLNTFLFGKAAFLLREDIIVLASMCSLLIFLTWAFFKEFKVLSFDSMFCTSLGFPTRFLDLFLTSLIVISVMIGLQVVGVILMAALLIIPAASARQWTNRLGSMCIISASIGAFSGVLGAFFSAIYPKMPTGPVMVLASASIFVFSLFFAPQRGLLFAWMRHRRNQSKIHSENIFKTIYKYGEVKENWFTPMPLMELHQYLSFTEKQLQKKCRNLRQNGYLQTVQEGETKGCILTEKGFQEATRVVRNHRLWELFLTHRMEIPDDHVHRDAEEMEHVLSPEIIEQLETLFAQTENDPHGKRIPQLQDKRG